MVKKKKSNGLKAAHIIGWSIYDRFSCNYYNYIITCGKSHCVVSREMTQCLKLQAVVVNIGHHHITLMSLCLSPQPQKPAGIDTEGPHSSLFRLIKTFAAQKGLMALIKGQ